MAREPRERRSVERAPARGERGRERTPPGARARARGSRREDGDDGRAGRLEQLLAAGPPREVLARLVDGDPLGIELRSRARLGQLALLVDPERLFLRAAARAAFAAPRWSGRPALAEWLDAQIDRAVADLLDEDRAAERTGQRPEPDAARYAFLAEALGVEPSVARRACLVFNDLPSRVRRAWWALVVEGKTMARCVAEGLGPRARLRADLRRALLALSTLEDPGERPGKGGDRDA